MLAKIKKNKQLFSNFSYMFAIEIANYILPFIAIPYIVRTVGVTNFGIITFAYVVISYFNLIVDYGFKLIIIKDISRYRNSSKKLSFLFWKMYFSQFILLIISIVIFTIIIQIPKFHEHIEVFIFAFGMVFGNILFPIWFFQGIEKMKYIAIFDFIARGLYVIAIFSIVQNKDDYIYVPLLNSLSFVLIGIFALLFIHYKFNINFVIPKFSQVKKFYRDGWHLFTAYISVNLYSNFNMVLLGFMAGYTSVGIYSLAEKIFGAIVKTVSVVNVVLFPNFASISSNKSLLVQKVKKVSKYYLIILSIISLFLMSLSEFIIRLLFGDGHENSILILQILSLVLLFRPFGQLFVNYLILKNQSKVVSKITIYTMVFNMILIFPMLYYLNEIGLALTVLLVQIFQVIFNSMHNKELFTNYFNRRKDE